MSAYPTDDPHRLATAPVVVGVDGSEAADLAVQWAAETAAQRRRALRIVHGIDLDATRAVLGTYDVLVPGVTEHLRATAEQRVQNARRLAGRVDSELRIDTEVSDAHPAELLVHESKSANMVVLGATDAGDLAHLGSTLLAVTAHGHGNIVVVRDTGSEQRTRHVGPVVVGVDGRRTSEAAIAAAFAEAAQRRTGLVAVHTATDIVIDETRGLAGLFPARELESAAHEILAERIAGWQEKYPDVPVVRHVSAAAPSHQLIAWSHNAQLVVVGTRGRGGFRGMLLGSTSNRLVQHAHCPVMVAHEH